MIQFDKDGVTLFYLDANGKKVSHNYLEGAAYDDMLTVMTAQIQCGRDNIAAVAGYLNALNTAQINSDAGRPFGAIPTKPLQKVVGDTGTVNYQPFVPALKEFVPTVTVPSGGIAQIVPDKQAIMYNMILAMFRQMFPNA